MRFGNWISRASASFLGVQDLLHTCIGNTLYKAPMIDHRAMHGSEHQTARKLHTIKRSFEKRVTDLARTRSPIHMLCVSLGKVKWLADHPLLQNQLQCLVQSPALSHRFSITVTSITLQAHPTQWESPKKNTKRSRKIQNSNDQTEDKGTKG
jgi:hypothetical protein